MGKTVSDCTARRGKASLFHACYILPIAVACGVAACGGPRESQTPLTPAGFLAMPLASVPDAGAEAGEGGAGQPASARGITGPSVYRLRGGRLTPSTPSCQTFDHVTRRNGTLTIQAAQHTAVARLPKPGEEPALSTFSGEANESGGELRVELRTTHVEVQNNCRWQISELIVGDVRSGSLGYEYSEELLDKTQRCSSLATACTAEATIDILSDAAAPSPASTRR